MKEPWKVTLFGVLRAQQGAHTITRFKSQKIASLFASLACHLGKTHSREFLIEMLWPDSSLDAGRNSLSVALSSLRSQLEPPGTHANSVIRADRFSVSLNPAAVTTDVAAFEAGVKASLRAPAAMPTEPRERLAAALDLYVGRLLPDLYDEWIAGEQERLSGLFSEGVSRLIGALEEAGDLPRALAYARHAVAAEPLWEEGHQSLMRLLAATGQPGAALRQYRQLERRLEDELGEEPSAPLRALARRIERDTGIAEAAVPPAARPPRPEPASPALSGAPVTRTFLMTDIEGSTGQWESGGAAYQEALGCHHAQLRREFAAHGGQEVSEAGDGFLVAFGGAGQALACAVACQQALAREDWPAGVDPPPVRMALHTGDVEVADGAYSGPTLHRASRLLAAAHGGQILVSEATAGVVRRDMGADVRLVDLGVHRLRDVPTPERLFQADFPGMAHTEFGPPRAESGHAPGLPLRFTRFFGRQREIDELADWLCAPETRLITLTGPGGTGKTRLALEVAEAVAPHFAGAVFFAPLADVADPGLIAGAVLDALRERRSPRREPLEQAAEALSRQPSLLALDNFEHLVDGGAPILQSLRARAPSLTVLVTSRQVLGLAGERAFPLSPLPTPDGPDTPERLSLFDSVRLFIDRAQQALPDFQVHTRNAPAVAELVSRLEGIPLAIELAAARAQVLSPAQMLAGVARRFDLLVSRRRDVAERQRTLWGTVEWSYDLLGPESQRFFCRLSVFWGGWTVAAAEAVCEEPLALDHLAQLQESSLVFSAETAEGMRFFMLETLREYGHEQLSPEERTLLARRHLAHFVQVAAVNSTDYVGGPAGEMYRVLDAEADNLKAAFAWSQQAGSDAEKGLLLAAHLSSYSVIRGFWKENRQALEQALQTGASVAPSARVAAWQMYGQLLGRMGKTGAGEAALQESLRLAEEIGDKWAIGCSLMYLGRPDEALRLFEEVGDDACVGWAKGAVMDRARPQGDLPALRWFHEQRLAQVRLEGARARLRGHLLYVGISTAFQGEYDTARALFEECRAVSEEFGHKAFFGYAVRCLGHVALAQEEYDAARAHYEESLRIFREVGDDLYAARALASLGEVALRQGDVETALTLSLESLRLCESWGRDVGDAPLGALRNLGKIALRRKEPRAAHRYFAEGLALVQASEEKYQYVWMIEDIAALFVAEKHNERAVRLFAAAAALRNSLGVPMPPVDRSEYEAHLAALRETLGDLAFAKAWEAGRALTWEQAVALAREESSRRAHTKKIISPCI